MTPTWRDQARCRAGGVPPKVFYTDTERSIRRAKKICEGCPVVAPCLDEGMKEPEGVWGGKTAEERALLTWLAA